MALFILLITLGTGAGAQDREDFRIVVDTADENGYNAGVGISTLVKIKVLPRTGIDLMTITAPGFLNAFSLVDQGKAEFAILKANWSDLAPNEGRRQGGDISHSVQMVAILWGGDGRPTTALVASSSVSRSAVYEVTKALFEHLPYLVGIEPDFSQTSIERAFQTSSLPQHGGALDYLNETSVTAAPASSVPTATECEEPAPSLGARSFTIQFGFDNDTLPPEAAVTIEEIERFAETLESPRITVAGYADSTGPADYNLTLAERRADVVVRTLQTRDLKALTIDSAAYGERSPFVVTPDEVREDRNRRVEILVEESRLPDLNVDRSTPDEKQPQRLVPERVQAPTF